MEVELEVILNQLKGVKKSGDGYTSLCPAHEDKNNSLSVTDHKGQILLHCFAGCPIERIVESLGLQLVDLFPPKVSKGPQIVKTYDYTDESGKLIFQVCRLDPKSFRQRHKVGNSWVWSTSGVRKVLYHLPEVIKAPALYFVEGEKDADNLIQRGLVATTSPGGANAWRDEYAKFLYGKRVILIPDNDTPGHAYAGQVACSLRGKATVSYVPLPCKDVSDWLAQGHDVSELPNMEQPIIDLLWGVIAQFRLDNTDFKKRILRLEQILEKPQTMPTIKKPMQQVGVKID